MPEKKRKRQPEEGERSGAKDTTNGARGATRIKVNHISVDHPRELDPIIASTPGIVLDSNINLQIFRSRKPAISRSKVDEILLHSSDHPRLDYTARQYQDGGAGDFLKHYVGVYDPSTGELQLVKAKKVSLRSTVRAEEEQVRNEERVKKTGMLSLRQELGMAFGTKKAKKAIESISQNAISPQKTVAEAIKSDPAAAAILSSMALSAASAPNAAALQAEIDNAKPRPKHNLDHGDKVEDVYPISSIVGNEVMREVKVKAWFDAIEEGEEVKTTCRFVSTRVEAIVEADDIPRLKVLRYILLLLNFYKTLKPGKLGGKRVPQKEELRQAMGCDNGLVETIRKRFADGGELTKWHVDNLMTHLAALSLIVDEFSSDIHDLCKDTGVVSKDMIMYYKEIGAKVVPMSESERTKCGFSKAVAADHKIARLTLPLEFPKQRKGMAAKSRR